MEALTYRLAEETDATFLAEVYNAAMPGGLVTAETQPVSTENRVAWLRAHDPARRPCWIAALGSDRVGFVCLSDFHPRPAYSITAEVTLYLHPAFQGKGLGRQMLAYAEEQAMSLGIETLVGMVYDVNMPSLRLFEKANYERLGYLPDVAKHTEGYRGLVLMVRRLYNTAGD